MHIWRRRLQFPTTFTLLKSSVSSLHVTKKASLKGLNLKKKNTYSKFNQYSAIEAGFKLLRDGGILVGKMFHITNVQSPRCLRSS